jgi:hypothetical protein
MMRQAVTVSAVFEAQLRTRFSRARAELRRVQPNRDRFATLLTLCP